MLLITESHRAGKSKNGTMATANKHGKQICAYWMTSMATSVT